MLNLEQAKILAQKEIALSLGHLKVYAPGDKFMIVEIVEFDKGWLFFFNSEKYLETHNTMYRPLGLGPVIVGKENGDVYQAGSGGNNEMWIEEFNEFLQAKGNSS